jgi:catechol 2,3-dioxygenase-like lactoylglutathione lyase family enzyme
MLPWSRRRREEGDVDIEFIATVAVIAPDPPASRRLYVDASGLPLQSQSGGDYVWTDKLEGAKHFAVWPLSQAAEACFGTSEWPADRPVPQVSIEFEVADVESVRTACDELEAAGHALLHPAREEPWGQTVARLQANEGSIVGISFIPSMH